MRAARPAVVAGLALLAAYTLYFGLTENHADFVRYRFVQTPAMGFCPDPDAPVSASIDRDSSGALVFIAAVFREAPIPSADCADELRTEQGCMAETLPSRVLSAAEAERVRSVFSSVKVQLLPAAACFSAVIDPCRIARHDWDGSQREDFICRYRRLPREQEAALESLLADLSDGR